MLIGPVTFLKLGKMRDRLSIRWALLPDLLPVYIDSAAALAEAGAEWVQIDEPCLVLDLDDATRSGACAQAYARCRAACRVKIMLATYFGAVGDNLDTALALPVAGLHVDLVRAPGQLGRGCRDALPKELVLSLGVIDGRNIWSADLRRLVERLEPAAQARHAIGVMIAPLAARCCMCRSIWNRNQARSGTEKLARLRHPEAGAKSRRSAEAANGKRDAVISWRMPRLLGSRASPRGIAKFTIRPWRARWRRSRRTMASATTRFNARRSCSRRCCNLPLLPTTTIGSLPADARSARGARRACQGRSERAPTTNDSSKEKRRRAMRWQDEIGIDVLVHGEFERNDMVQYFGEQLSGFAFTEHGWVQSYGSRCVKPADHLWRCVAARSR